MMKTYLLLFCLILAACGGHTATSPAALLDAESHTDDGLQAFSDDDRDRAQQLFSRALVLYQSLDNQHGAVLSHINLAEVHLALAEYPASIKHLDAATGIANKNASPGIQPRITLLYSLNALKQNKITQAEKIVQPLLPAFDSNNTPRLTPDNIQLVAIAHRTNIAFVQKQDAALWTQRYSHALKKSALTAHSLKARLLRFQATLQQEQQDYRGAESNLQQALSEYKSQPFRPGIAVTLSELGQLSIMQKRWLDAREYFNRSIAVYRYLKDFEQVSQLNGSLAKVELAIAESLQ